VCAVILEVFARKFFVKYSGFAIDTGGFYLVE